MTSDDATLTVDWMVRQYGFDRQEVEGWVRDLHFNWPLSVKAISDCVNALSCECVSADAVNTNTLTQSHISTITECVNTLSCECVSTDAENTNTLTQSHNNAIIGLLNMSDYRIEEETPFIAREKPELLAAMNAQRYTAVFSFIVAPEYRGTRLNYDMIMSIMPELKANYDFVFIPVLHRLKTHLYWQRWGATEFYRDSDCVYYQLPLR